MTAWTDHLKSFASTHGITYGAAMKSPECKSSYKARGTDAPKTGNNIQMVISEQKTRGRPKKYATEEEAKKAKSASSVASNKRRKGELSGQGGKQSVDNRSLEDRIENATATITALRKGLKKVSPDNKGRHKKYLHGLKEMIDMKKKFIAQLASRRERGERGEMGDNDTRTQELENKENAEFDALKRELQDELDKDDDDDYNEARGKGLRGGELEGDDLDRLNYWLIAHRVGGTNIKKLRDYFIERNIVYPTRDELYSQRVAPVTEGRKLTAAEWGEASKRFFLRIENEPTIYNVSATPGDNTRPVIKKEGGGGGGEELNSSGPPTQQKKAGGGGGGGGKEAPQKKKAGGGGGSEEKTTKKRKKSEEEEEEDTYEVDGPEHWYFRQQEQEQAPEEENLDGFDFNFDEEEGSGKGLRGVRKLGKGMLLGGKLVYPLSKRHVATILGSGY